MNKAIYVFTIVTVIYTPLGFMAVSDMPKPPTGKKKVELTKHSEHSADLLGLAHLQPVDTQ